MRFIFFIYLLSFNYVFAQTILLEEEFAPNSQNGLPELWSQSTLSNDGGWLNGTSSQLQSQWWGIQPHGNFIATNDDACDCNKSEDYLITPPLNFSGLDNAILSFASYFSGETFEGSTDKATIEYSLNGGNSWIVLTEIDGNGNSDNTVWENHNVNLTELLGYNDVLLAFHYDDDGGWMFGWAIDDVVIYEPIALNAEMTLLTFPTTIELGSTVSIEGVITNIGADIIESFDVVWSQGGSMSYSQSYEDLNIASGNSYNFLHQDQFYAESPGLYSIDVTVTNVNGQQDEDITNNSLNNSIMVIEYGEIYSGQFLREYIYFKPSNAQDNCPLVFVCHGYTGTAQDIMNYSHFNDLAIEYGFAVCYPQGIEDSGGNTFFNVGYDFQNNETVDDVAFLEDLIDLFSVDNSIDTDQVFCTGMSNGGDFCYLLACEASESFLGVAPISGMIMQDIMDNCSPSQNVGILEIHGTQDNITYYNGDVFNQDGWGAYPSIPSTIDFFVDLYDLELNSTGNFPNIVSNDGSTVSYEKYGVEEECTKVWLYTVNGGGHDWPGAYGNMDIDSSREAWLFFEDLCASCENGTCTGCTDSEACNFNPVLTEDDGTCVYAVDGYDCNGACLNDTDGDGVCDSICPEDLNSDGYITIQDILFILSEFGCTSLCENDINQDNFVTVDDLLQVLSEFGNTCE
jgi:polyhydroxybutyrate depolymerase